MTGLSGSASLESGRAVVVSPSWVGDAMMAFPAVQALRARRPGLELSVLAKPRVAPLWGMCRAVSQVLLLEPGLCGSLNAARQLKAAGFRAAWILPNSWRTAWIPWLAGVPVRTGFAGHYRRAFLTEIVPPFSGPVHQSMEMARLLGVESGASPGGAGLDIPAPVRERIAEQLSGFRLPRIVLIPGAARGPSKRWPPDRFAEAGRRLAAEWGGSVLVCGGGNERDLCETVARAAGGCSWAGRTSLEEWAALLSLSQFVLCNDSGGMHLATALGTPGVAIFGKTDPAVTGPMGGRIRVLRAHAGPANRAIRRDDREARLALEALSVERVLSEARAAREGGAQAPEAGG
jgi:heptosyltransferase-2